MLIIGEKGSMIIDAKVVRIWHRTGGFYDIRAEVFADDKFVVASYFDEKSALNAIRRIYNNAQQGRATDLSLPIEKEGFDKDVYTVK